MSSLQKALDKVGSSFVLSSIIIGVPETQHFVRQAAARQVNEEIVKRRLEHDRIIYGITEEQQRELLRTGIYEAVIIAMKPVCDREALTINPT